mgnify:CR=1 FL=1
MPDFNLTQFAKHSPTKDTLQVPPVEPVVATENTAYTSSVASATLDDATNLVRVVCTADAFMLAGAAPTALATSQRLLANEVYWFETPLASSLKLAFYDGTT